jgi:hypothetical protein
VELVLFFDRLPEIVPLGAGAWDCEKLYIFCSGLSRAW